MADTAPPSTPTALNATAASSTSVQLKWAASTDNVAVTGYRIYRDGSQVATATTTQYTATGLSPSTSYTFHVVAVDAAGNLSRASTSATATTPGTQAIVDYDFSRGDTLAAKNGWRFHSNWALSPVPGANAMGLPFTYQGTADGVYPNNAEMRFDMPAQSALWLRVRLHEPTNYVHRHNTSIDVANAAAAGWRVGDQLLAHDGVSKGTISSITPTSVFVRWAEKSAYDIWGNSSAIRTIRNTTNNTALNSTRKSVWDGSKIMALWVDGYSQAGTGPTVILGLNSDWTFGSSKDPLLTAGYTATAGTSRTSVGGITGGKLFTAAHRGKYLDLAVHVRFSSQPRAKDGVIQTWVRYEGEAAYTLRHNIRNADMDRPLNLAGDRQLWQKGYLMGWSNVGFDEETTFHISKIEVFGQQPADLMGVTP
ncbi:MAG: fibronectin type III domain-containing protein [Acidovorax sp.]